MNTLKNKMFTNYEKTHNAFLDTDDKSKLLWFERYLQRSYLAIIADYPVQSEILEIGCNKGYLLAALKKRGFENLTGVDLSPEALDKAQILLKDARLFCDDAFAFLNDKTEKYDIIIMKAVLEHVEKKKIIPFLDTIKGALRGGGVLIIDVPNMDWIFASHERYMDFTHEVGFTQESLGQISRQLFDNVMIKTIDNAFFSSFLRSAVGHISRSTISFLFRCAGEPTSSVWHRSVIAACKKNINSIEKIQ